MDKLIAFLKKIAESFNEINTTNAKILATIVFSALTAIRYLFLTNLLGPLDESIFNSWLIFLAALGGLDVTQYAVKRRTFVPEATTAGQTDVKSVVMRRDSSEHKGVEPSL